MFFGGARVPPGASLKSSSPVDVDSEINRDSIVKDSGKPSLLRVIEYNLM